jgi:hypothetical protein
VVCRAAKQRSYLIVLGTQCSNEECPIDTGFQKNEDVRLLQVNSATRP